MKQTPQEQVKNLTDKLVSGLCRTDERPEDWLPHTVYVEEVGEDEKLGDIPVYTRYTLEDYKPDGSCTFRNAEGEYRTGHLHEICIDWFVTLWSRYAELCAEQGLWRERAIHMLEQEADAALSDILEFVGEHWQNLASDEENIEAFRQWTGTDKHTAARGQAAPEKRLTAFVWPCDLMDRNVSDQEILAAYETKDDVGKFTRTNWPQKSTTTTARSDNATSVSSKPNNAVAHTMIPLIAKTV